MQQQYYLGKRCDEVIIGLENIFLGLPLSDCLRQILLYPFRGGIIDLLIVSYSFQ